MKTKILQLLFKISFMKHIYFLSFSLVLILLSCNQENSLNYKNAIYISDDNIPPLKQVHFEQVDLPEESCMNSKFFVYKDTILIICPFRPETYCMSVMNMNTKEIICRFLRRGNGPGEVLDCHFVLRQNRLIVDDATQKLIFFNIDTLILKGQEYKPQTYQLETFVTSAEVLSDTSFLFANRWYMDGCGNKVNETVPELIVSDIDSKFNFEIPQGASAVMSENSSILISNIKKHRVFIAYSYKPQFTLLNSELDTIKIIFGPDPIEKRKYKKDNASGGIVPETCSYYVMGSAISTDSHIFVCSSRLQNIPRKEIREVSRKNQDEIFQFDWEGNMVARYQMTKENKFLGVCGYSEESNVLYVLARDNDDEYALFKAQL